MFRRRYGRPQRQADRCFIGNEGREVSGPELREWCWPERVLMERQPITEHQRQSMCRASLDRAKTGRAAAGTLTPWSEKILESYMACLGVELLDNAPIFRTAGSVPGPKGGRRWLPQPYSTSKMDRDFREIRAAVFSENEHRQLADMRRSGAVEGDAGEGSLTDQSNKMANTVAASSRLRKTYNPVNIVSARRFDEARERGRKAIEDSAEEQRPTKSVISGKGEVS